MAFLSRLTPVFPGLPYWEPVSDLLLTTKYFDKSLNTLKRRHSEQYNTNNDVRFLNKNGLYS